MRDGKLTRNFIKFKSKKPYQGRHRENELPNGVGLIPLGDRNRALFGSDVLEERESLGKYDNKFLSDRVEDGGQRITNRISTNQ